MFPSQGFHSHITSNTLSGSLGAPTTSINTTWGHRKNDLDRNTCTFFGAEKEKKYSCGDCE
jgi:hypothetical protein